MPMDQPKSARALPLRETFAAPPDEVLQRLRVRRESGLGRAEVRRRLDQFGPNLLKERRPRSALRILFDQLTNLIVGLLAVAATLSFLFGEWTEGGAILVVIVINSALGFFTEFRAIRSMEALRRLSIVTAKVRREGRVEEITSRQLVPGDIVLLESGDIVSADMRLLSASKLRCDESILTGESLPVGKQVGAVESGTPVHDRTNMAFQGTAVTGGSAEGVVVATGVATELGQIAALAEEAEEPSTPLERRLQDLSRQLVWVTLGLVAVIGGVGILGGKPALLMIETAIALAVAAVPEGLPMVATLALARGMWRMARRNALIERLSAVETLGATTAILTDKTGTLTENRMTVRRLAFADGAVEVTPTGFRKGGADIDAADLPVLRSMLETAMLCNNASLAPDPEHPGERRVLGDPMEGALLIAGEKAGLDRARLVESWPEVREEPFDEHTRMMATVHRRDGAFFIAVKGAPEAVLDVSSHVAGPDGPRPLTDADRQSWIDTVGQFAGDGLRLLAFASKRAGTGADEVYGDLTLLGLAGLYDPPREDAADAIATCRQAGIHVVMVTGDHAITARRIADAVGLTDPDSPGPLEGRALGAIASRPAAERERLQEIPVFARVSPKQKLDLIAAYQESGAIVAMTGDGVNDAPALRRADIGIAMGRRGSQVAREAADVVLQDDSLATLVGAIAQGRVIFGNIRKFILYLLSCNLSEIMVVGVASLSGMPLPILPLQILFLNLVTDVFPAFALGVGEGERDVMQHPPRDPREPLMPARLWAAVVGHGAVITVATLTGFLVAMEVLEMDGKSAVTISFLTLALAQLWHVFNMRDVGTAHVRNEITRNGYVWAALALCLGLLFGAIYVPYVAGILGLVPPSAAGWALAVGLSVVPLVLGQIVKIAGVRRVLLAAMGHSR